MKRGKADLNKIVNFFIKAFTSLKHLIMSRLTTQQHISVLSLQHYAHVTSYGYVSAEKRITEQHCCQTALWQHHKGTVWLSLRTQSQEKLPLALTPKPHTRFLGKQNANQPKALQAQQWETHTVHTHLKVPLSTSWPLRRTWMPSLSSDPKAMYSPRAQSTCRFWTMSALPRRIRDTPGTGTNKHTQTQQHLNGHY